MEQRMQAPLQALLQPGEQVRIRLHAQSVVRFWVIGIQIFVVELYLITKGMELKSWVLGVTIGIYVLLTLRSFFLFLTDRRLLVVRLAAHSTKKWSFEGEIDAAHIKSIAYQDKLLQDRLLIEPTEGKQKRFTVVRGWEEEARRLASPQRIEPV